MTTLRDGLAVYLSHCLDMREKTRRKLGYLVNSWQKRTNDPLIENIAAETFMEFRRNCLTEKLSPDTIETSITDVLTILDANGLQPDAGRRLRRKTPAPNPPSLAVLAKLYVAADKCNCPRLAHCSATDWLRAFLVVAYWTGLRLGDLIAMKRENFSDEVIRHQASKTSKRHEWPACSAVSRHIVALARGRSDRLFDVSQVCPSRVRGWIEMLCEAASVPVITPKQLRQLSITQWMSASPVAGGIIQGKDLGVLANYLGQRTVLERAAPSFVWPDVMLSKEDLDRRRCEEADLIAVVKRLRPERLADLRRVALAFAE